MQFKHLVIVIFLLATEFGPFTSVNAGQKNNDDIQSSFPSISFPSSHTDLVACRKSHNLQLFIVLIVTK